MEASPSNRYVRGTPRFLPQVEWTPRCLIQKNVRFPCSGLNVGSSFISQDERMSESPVETLEKAPAPCLIWIGSLISLSHLKGHMEFNASKGDNARLFLKIDWNPNITAATRKGCSVPRLTSRSVHIALPGLLEIPELSLIARQESRRR